ncbi:Protein of unknown function DUF131 [Ignisphaera aggregans DSM 17230]|uniref:DUF131 domain-containing protein n=1 Tax=Ignisphaera aggregans (strain DSM 17230 / JCM 13409 / AQ1.S1) TaxID=583356 RepID=E0SRJ4_IGNAA|nr:Protein of unknown function DUF131 [Ignisphaera aggregans DSM 17230]
MNEKYGFVLIVIGVLMAFTSIAILFIASIAGAMGSENISVVGGGCIVIGFIPICIGTSVLMTVIVMIIAIVMIVTIFLLFWLSRRYLEGVPRSNAMV